MFRRSGYILFVCVSVLLVAVAMSASAQSLTGLFEFATDSNGNFTGPGWNARGNDGGYNLWVIQGNDLNGAFLNGPSDAQANINLPLALGDNTFTIYSNAPQPFNTFGLSLFFNDSVTTPGISVFAPVQTSEATAPPFTANSAANTRALDGSIVPGSGTLSFTDTNSGRIITLTDYRFAQSPLFNQDRIGNLSTGADGVGDNIGQFTLHVTIPVWNVGGVIALQGTQDAVQPVDFTFRPTTGSAFTRTVTLNFAGGYNITSVPVGQYTVSIKGAKWLRKNITVDASTGNVTNANATLLAGDANNDNFADIADLLLLIASYNKVSPNAGYSDAADLNSDRANDITDLLLLIANYNKQGDS